MKFEQMHMDDFVSRAGPETDAPVLLWVDSDQLTFHPVDLPRVSARKLQQMLPWLVEDQLLTDPESIHLVRLPACGDEPDTLVAVSRQTMNAWSTLTAETPAPVRAMVPDVLALPWETGCISLARQASRWLVRTGNNSGFSGSEAFVKPILLRALSADAGLQLHCYGFAEAPLALDGDRIHCRKESVNWATAVAPPVNLLSGDYRRSASRLNMDRWWPALAAGLAAFALAIVWLAVDHRIAGNRLAEVNQTLVQDYQTLFGTTAPALQGLRETAEAELRQRELLYFSDQSSVLPLVRQLDPVLSNCRDCVLHQIRLQPESGELLLGQGASAVAGLRQLEGWQASTSTEQDQVRVQLERNGL